MSEQQHGSGDMNDREARFEALLQSIDGRLEELSRRQLLTDDFVWGSRERPEQPSLISRLKEVEGKIEGAQRTVRWFAGPSLITLLATLTIGWMLLGKVADDEKLTQQLLKAVQQVDAQK